MNRWFACKENMYRFLGINFDRFEGLKVSMFWSSSATYALYSTVPVFSVRERILFTMEN
jgi:hypothetical protein